jgi:hypothetical protein
VTFEARGGDILSSKRLSALSADALNALNASNALNALDALNALNASSALSVKEKEIYKEKEKAEKIFNSYPRKVGKPKAIKSILKAMKKFPEDSDYLLQATIKFAKSRVGQDPEFTPYPATWFNQERYNDDEPWKKGELHAEGDPAGFINGVPAVWKKVGDSWARI